MIATDNGGSRQIRINGQPLEVALSLWEALLDLQSKILCPKLRTDTICINQKDNVETGDQVSQMYCIYKHAKRVIE
jgi:hypothetical protein